MDALFLLSLISIIVCVSATICDMPTTDKFIQDIPEDWPVNTVLRHLNVNGDDSEIFVYEDPSLHDPHVSFNSISRNITLVQPLDAEDTSIVNNQISLRIRCQIISTGQTVEHEIIIILLDVNDNSPMFQQSQYFAQVNELTPLGTTIMTGIRADDADMSNNYVYYVIEDGPYSDYFDIPIPAQGAITLQRSLDFEETQQLTITVVAKDNQSPVLNRPQLTLNGTCTVTVAIADGDDQNPQFVEAPYSVHIEENFPADTAVEVFPHIYAIDGDTGINANISYSIVQDSTTEESSYFTVGAADGVLYLTRPGLSRNSVVVLQVQATQADNPSRFNIALVRVYVSASNSNPPHFSQPVYPVSLVENVPIGTSLVKVMAADNDESPQASYLAGQETASTEGSVLTYSLPAQMTSNIFTIDSTSGQVATSALLDFETVPFYNITVSVTDGLYVTNAVVSVTVLDINDNAPYFGQTSYEFNARREVGYLVGQIIAEDDDSNSMLTYHFLEITSLFTISSLGEISVTADAESLPFSNYKLVVVATDTAAPPSSGSAVVDVIFEVNALPSSGAEENEVDTLLLIILGVICGILLVIIILLLAYIYRNKRNYVTDKEHRMRAQTFEQRRFSMQQQTKETQQRQYIDDPKMTQYKQNAAHHLALFNTLDPDMDATQPQENPFVPDDTYDGIVFNNTDINRNRNDSIYSTATMQHRDSVTRHMPYVHEIDYETSVAPMEPITDESYSDSTQSSIHSVADSHQRYSAGGSTQNLVTPKGTIKSRTSGVSFIEAANQGFGSNESNSRRDPRMSAIPAEDKTGITVYY